MLWLDYKREAAEWYGTTQKELTKKQIWEYIQYALKYRQLQLRGKA